MAATTGFCGTTGPSVPSSENIQIPSPAFAPANTPPPACTTTYCFPLCSNVVTTRSSVERLKPFSSRMFSPEISGAFWPTAFYSGESAPFVVARPSGIVAMPASWKSAM